MPTPTAPPSLGYGQRAEAPINAVNQYMRSAPWYQALLRSFGQDPNNVHLNDQQKQQVIKTAQANGIVVDEGHDGQEVDDSGNFHAKSHKLRNTLIVAGIAGAALATMGAAGVFAGAGGAASAGAGAGVAGVEGGAAGLSSGALAGLGTGAMGSVAVPASIGAASAAGAGAGAAAFDAAGNFIGPSTVSSVGGSGAAGGGLWSHIAGYAKSHAGDIGNAISDATGAAGQNRLNQENLGMQANRDNINGNREAEAALMARSKQEAGERHSALIDVARASDERNPNISPFNTRGPKTYSPEYMSTLTALEQAGMARLKANPTYSTDNMPTLRPYRPLDIKDLQGETDTKPGLFERIGQWAGPGLSLFNK